MQFAFRFQVFLIWATVALLGVPMESSAQATQQQEFKKIIKGIQKVLPSGWQIVESEMATVPKRWPSNYSAYRFFLQNPTVSFEESVGKGPGGQGVRYGYSPFYTLYFVPRRGSLSVEQARQVDTQPETKQEGHPRLYGASDEYILLYDESSKTGWPNGMSVIAKAFEVKPVGDGHQPQP